MECINMSRDNETISIVPSCDESLNLNLEIKGDAVSQDCEWTDPDTSRIAPLVFQLIGKDVQLHIDAVGSLFVMYHPPSPEETNKVVSATFVRGSTRIKIANISTTATRIGTVTVWYKPEPPERRTVKRVRPVSSS